MLLKLRKLGNGCHVHNLFLGCLMYADDLLLVSASIADLQRMLDVCSDVGTELCITFNSNKSHCLVIGPNKINKLEPITLSNLALEWVNSIKYLGISLVSGKGFTVELCRNA